MAVRSQFFDSVDGDRIVDAQEFSQHLASINSDGIIQDNDTDGLRVLSTDPDSMAVDVQLGSMFILGRFVEVFDSPETLTIADNTSGSTREDGVFARLDLTNREVRFVVKTGDISITRDSVTHELRLARVQVLDGATAITNDDIFDDRADIFLCGKSKPTTLRQNFQNTTTTAGWKTVAVNNGQFSGIESEQDAHALFVLRSDDDTSLFGGTHFVASFNNNSATVTLLHRGQSSASDGIDGIRVTWDSTTGNSAVQVNTQSASVERTIEIYHNYSHNGWFPVNWTSGTSFGTEVTLDFTSFNALQGFANEDGHNNTNTYIVTDDGQIRTNREITIARNNFGYRGTETNGTTRHTLLVLNDFNNVQVGTNLRQLFLFASQTPQFTSDGATFFDLFHAGFVQPQARVFHSANQSIADVTDTALAFDSERWDTDTIHDTATNNSRLTAQTSGLYQIEFSGEWDTSATGQRQFYIRLNGVTTIASVRHDASSASTTQMTLSAQYQLTSGDYVEVVAFQNSGGALNVLTNAEFSPEFSMSFISPI